LHQFWENFEFGFICIEPDEFCLNLIVALIDPDFGVVSALSSSLVKNLYNYKDILCFAWFSFQAVLLASFYDTLYSYCVPFLVHFIVVAEPKN